MAVTTTTEALVIAPKNALCAVCGCVCGGDVVTLTQEYDRVLDRHLPTYRHASARGCDAARERSAAFWREA